MLSAIKCVYSAQVGAWGRGMTVGGQCVTVYGGNVERAWSGPRLISICASRCWLVSRPLAGHLPALQSPSLALPVPSAFPLRPAYTAYTSMRASLPASCLRSLRCLPRCGRLSASVSLCVCVSLPLLLLLLLSPCLLLLFSLLLRVSAFRQRLKNFQFSVAHKRSPNSSNNNDVATFVCLVARAGLQ